MITGSVKDISGAIVPGAAVSVKNLETGLNRTSETDESGNYRFSALPVGPYEVNAEKAGFKMALRRGITLVVGQEAVVDLALEVGAVEQTVTVTAEAALVNTTLSSTSGLINEQQVKDLPLNGRSFDQLLTLNVGTANYSSNNTRNAFSVSGRRPDENRFLINGIDYIGTSHGLDTNPYGSSGQVLGVEAVREFNVLTNTYGPEYGKKAGGQINIITSSGTNQLHGSAFEYLRNNALDARNFFDRGEPPPFRRNQFGGSLGGPIKRDNIFLFGSYEGFRQRLGGSGQAVVPDMDARRGFLPVGPNNSLIQVPDLQPRILPYLTLWREPNGPNLGGGTALAIYNPVTAIREDMGTLRLDYNLSANDSLSGNYMVDDGIEDAISNVANTISTTLLQAKVVSLQETRIFSPTLLNVLTLGYTRAYYAPSGATTVPIPDNLKFSTNAATVGSISIGGGIAGTQGGTVSSVSGGGATLFIGRNIYTVSDSVSYSKGRHSLGLGLWWQRHQINTGYPNSSGTGTVSYATLLAMLQDRPTAFQGVTNIFPLSYRTTFGAWFVQDDIKLQPNLSLRLGLREERTTGYREKTCRAGNYEFDRFGIIETEPFLGCSPLTENNAVALFQPRVGLAWDPTGTGAWSVRAGFSIAHNLQDDLVHRLWNPPLNGVVDIRNTPLLSFVPLPGNTPPDPNCNAERVLLNLPCKVFAPGGIEPTFKTPTVQQWSLAIERQLMANLMLRVGYVGSEAYHMQLNMNMNPALTQICQNPAGCVSGGVGTARGLAPQGKEYFPPGTRANPYVGSTYSWFMQGTSSYHALDLSLVRRMSAGLSFKLNYSWSKALDQGSSNAGSTGSNQPQIVWNRYNVRLNNGVAAFSLLHQSNANFSYELPFGSGQPWGSGVTGVWDKLISGWQWNGIIQAQSGFPTTPRTGRNITGSGDTRNPDAPDWNPNFSGDLMIGTPAQWYNPAAFSIPIAGTFGNVGRGPIRGPRLFNLDMSLFKKIPISERFNLQFRAEAFNLFNHTNFGTPNPVNFSGNNISPSAARITSTATRPRNLQFALRLTF